MKSTVQENSIRQLSEDLLEVLGSEGYRSGTMDNYRRILSQISMFMSEKQITGYTEEIGKTFYTDYTEGKDFSKQWQQRLKTVLRRLDELHNGIEFHLTRKLVENPAPVQFTGLMEAYLGKCAGLGNKEGTIIKKKKYCKDFLHYLADLGCKSGEEINWTLICQALLRFSNKDSYAILCSFLYFLYETGTLKHDYSGSVPKYRRNTKLPDTYTDGEIKRLEQAIDTTTKTGKRDYAMILLAARLGMRSGDIARMTIDNLDFSRNRITFTQQKTHQPQELVLLSEIKEAILDYMENARPDVKRSHVFIRGLAPFDKITTRTIRHALTRYLKAAKIDISSKKHGPHTLRSSMATSMVNSGVPYEVVRKALGHNDPQAVKHYAKTDVENLRLYSIDIPDPSGTFKLFLEGRGRND